MEQHVLRPSGGMNFDDHPSSIPNGDYISLENYRIFSSNSEGNRMTPLLGDSEIANIDLPVGTNKTLLALKDPSELKVYIFIYNSALNHTIWIFDSILNTFQLLVEGPYLNFSNSPLLATDANIRDGLLYWNHGNFNSYEISGTDQQFSPPRKINIEKAIAFQNGTAGAYANMDWQTIEAVKYPYAMSPACSYASNELRKSNFLKGKLFQFRLQYVYDDNEEARWSPVSKLALPTNSETMGGSLPFNPERDNKIVVTANTGHHTVSRIRFLFREGNTGAWYVFNEKDKVLDGLVDNTVISVDFLNNEEKLPVEIADQNFDLLPQVAQTQEYLTNEEIAYGKCLEGFDFVNIDGIDAVYNIENLLDGANGIAHHELVTEIVSDSGDIQKKLIIIEPNYEETLYFIPQGTVLTLQTRDSFGDSEVFIYETTVDYIGTQTVALQSLLIAWRNFLAIEVTAITFAVEFVGVNGWVLTLDMGIPTFTSVLLNIDMPNKRYRSWKTGTDKVFGIQYYDEALRDGTVYTNDACKFYVKTRVEEDRSGLTDDQGAYQVNAGLRITASQQPPIWARYYQLVVARNVGIRSSQDRSVRKIQVSSEYSGRVKISLEKYYRENYDGATYHHTIQKGDRVRLIRAAHPVSFGHSTYVREIIDLTVLRYEESGGEQESEAIYVTFFDWEEIVRLNEAFMIEISRGSTDESGSVWEEVGETFNVVNPHTATRVHLGQVLGVTGTSIQTTEGDVYIRLRDMGTGFTSDPHQHKNWYVEDFDYSDYFVSNFTNRGRLAIKNLNNRQTWNNVIRSSNKFIQDTRVNGLSRFDALSKINLTGDYGAITRMVEVGFTLKVVTRAKEFSIYINRQEPTNNSGNFVLIDKTFGTVRPALNDWGTLYPASVFVHDRSLYYWDIQQVALVQSNANGQINIAGIKFKMSTKFKLISDQAIEFGDILTDDFVIGVDDFNQKILFSYKISGQDIKETIVFNLQNSRFEHFVHYFSECMIAFRDEYFSFEGGVLYKQETGPLLQFRGVQKTLSFYTSSSFDDVSKVKTFVNMDCLCDKSPGQGIVRGNTDGSYSSMMGYFFAHLWYQIENEWCNSLTGDPTLVQNVASPLARHLDGRDIRGNYFTLTLTKAEDFPTITHFMAYYLNSPI
jgi:hypothetical protein